MSRRSAAIASSRARAREFDRYRVNGAGGFAVPTKMDAEELRQHLMMRGRNSIRPGKNRDAVKGGGNSKRYAFA